MKNGKKTENPLEIAGRRVKLYLLSYTIFKLQNKGDIEMGKQYNKVQKRARLKRYIERQKAKARAAMKPSKKK